MKSQNVQNVVVEKLNLIKNLVNIQNGHWNETFQFSCNYTVTFSPNFMAYKAESDCQRSEAYKLDRQKVKIARDKLLKYIERMDVNDKLKKIIIDKLDYLPNYGFFT